MPAIRRATGILCDLKEQVLPGSHRVSARCSSSRSGTVAPTTAMGRFLPLLIQAHFEDGVRNETCVLGWSSMSAWIMTAHVILVVDISSILPPT